MTSGPVPPHERSWRHPSELAAAEREAIRTAEPAPGVRTFAMVSGSVGLLAIALLVVTITPGRLDPPVAISATTSPAPNRPSGILTPAPVTESPSATPSPSRPIVSIASTVTTTVSPGSVPVTQAPDPDVVTLVLATPVGDGRQALATMRSTGQSSTPDAEIPDTTTDDTIESGPPVTFDVQLESGLVVSASIVRTTPDGLLVLEIFADDVAAGRTIANHLPGPDDLVTVMLDPPIVVPFSRLAELEVIEGVPVLDASGALVGLCSRHGDASVLLDATGDGLVGTSTTVPTSEPTTPATSSEPPSSSVPPASPPAPIGSTDGAGSTISSNAAATNVG